MAHSFHRCPVGQRATLTLSAGNHEMLCGLSLLADEKQLEWVIGIADAETKLFLSPEELTWK